jgi:uncharacterized membrane protein (UPF0136 family)
MMLKMIGNSMVTALSQRIAGTGDTGIIPTALIATGANMVVSRKNIPAGLALVGVALFYMEYQRRTDETHQKLDDGGLHRKDARL